MHLLNYKVEIVSKVKDGFTWVLPPKNNLIIQNIIYK